MGRARQAGSSLKTKVVAVLGLVLVLLTAANLGVQGLVVWPTFVELERSDARADGERAVEAIQAELQGVDNQTRDYATWDDAWRFMEERGQAFLDTLTPASMTTTRMNLYAIYAPDGALVWSRAIDLESGEPIAFEAFSGALPADNPFVAHAVPGGSHRGILRTEHGPLLAASRPIVTSNGDGPVRGAFVMGRLLTPTLVDDLQARTKVAFGIDYADPAALSPADADAVRRVADGGGLVVEEREGGRLATFATLPGPRDAPALLVRATTPREISAVGRHALVLASASTLAAGLLVLVAAAVALGRLVMAPLGALTGHVLSIGRTGDLGRRSGIDRADEIGALAREFDATVAQLQETRARLLEQSFHSGRAEMASGVLHNVRNALSPVAASVWRLGEAARQTMPANLERALRELPDEPNAERRRKLARYAEATIRESYDQRLAMVAELDLLAEQNRHIERIVQDHAAHTLGLRQLAPEPVAPVIDEALRLVAQDQGRPIRLGVDPWFREAPPVLAHRAVLSQVIGNLVVNAAEALRESDQPAPAITVDGALEHDGDRPMLRISVRDNGTGIPADVLPRLFERGFSTRKGRTGGIGLHWCANSVGGMAGRIRAESAGAGQGAAFHLWLPIAAEVCT